MNCAKRLVQTIIKHIKIEEVMMIIINLLKPIASLISNFKYKADRLRLKKRIMDGLKIGKNVYIMLDVEFDVNYPFLIEIGDNCRISKGVRILSHDATTFRKLGITRLAPVRILEGTFIGEKAIILPGVTIGPRALIAAGSVVNRDIGEDKAAAGNPARPYGSYSELVEKYAVKAKSSAIFNKIEFERGNIGLKKIKRSIDADGVAFVSGVPQKDPYYINTDMEDMRKKADDNLKKLKLKNKKEAIE